jgi:hypothetical protein
MELAHEMNDSVPLAWLAVLAAALLMTAIYTHLQIPRYTAGTAKIARAVLLVVGIGLGVVSAVIYAEEGGRVSALLAFLIGFGVVHVPTAIILLLKRARGAGKS